MKKLKVVALLVVMMCGLVGCKEDVEVHTEYVKAQPLQLHIEETVQETVEQAKVNAEIAMEEAKKEFSPYYVVASSLNIRQAPDTNSSLVGSLVFGDCVNAYVDGEWAELDNGTYISAEYLTSELLYTAYAAPYTSGMKSYMPYSVGDKSIFTQSSNQYKLQELCNTGNYGIRQYNGRYCVAIGSYFGTAIGQYFDLIPCCRRSRDRLHSSCFLAFPVSLQWKPLFRSGRIPRCRNAPDHLHSIRKQWHLCLFLRCLQQLSGAF